MASPNFSEIVATTIENRSRNLADNATKQTALLDRLKKRGNVRPVSGGRTIVQELEYALNQSVTWYSGYDTLSVAPSDIISAAEFNMAMAAVAVVISGQELLQNDGEERFIDLLAARIENAKSALITEVAAGCYSDGSGSGGKQIGGLQLLVDTTPSTGTVGGINAATYDFWRNIASVPVGAPTSANIQSRMNAVATQLVRGNERPDLIICDNNYYIAYLESLQAIQRITSESDSAGAGFSSLKYYGAGSAADVVLDGGVGGGCPANTMYFLNTKYIHFRPYSKRNFTTFNKQGAINQDAIVQHIGFAGNMTVSNRRMQGVLTHS